MNDLAKPTHIDWRLIEARRDILQNIWGPPKLYNHAVFCSVGLPHRAPKPGLRTYEKQSGSVSLQLQAGHAPDRFGAFQEVGLPYGPRARLLLLHLCSMAVKNRSPIVEVEDSFTAFARSLGLGTCGKSLKSLREQVLRMSVVSMRLAMTHHDWIDCFQGNIFSRFRAEIPSDTRQKCLFPSFVEFSTEFYSSLTAHAVPMRMEAIAALKHSSRALDIYAWLSYRLWRLDKPTKIRWTSLRFQFGVRTQEIKSFKRMFKVALKQVLYVYPEAKVKVESGGVLIAPSQPPVPFRKRIA